MKQKIFAQDFYLTAGDVNAQGKMALTQLVARMIDIATAHANSLHLGNPDMVQHKAGWVLSRIAVQMDSYPMVNEKFTLSTWVERWTRRFSVRCYMVSDAEGHPVGYARSIWMILQTETHESLPLSILDFDDNLTVADKCPVINSEKHRPIAEFGAEELPSDALPSTAPAARYTFQYCDLDFYRHVNTVRYVSLLLNQFTLETMDAYEARQLEISFMQEGHYGEEVEVRRHEETPTSTSMSIVGHDGREILFARLLLTANSLS